MAESLLSGGKAEGMSVKDFNPKQIAMGKKVEREHTTNPAVAVEIAKDHLAEFPNYYTALNKMEKRLEEGKSASVWLTRQALE